MHREHHRWWSPRLRRDMELLQYGHGGTPLLAFPSSMGRFYEWEDFGMVDALGDKLRDGHNMLFCVDSVDRESLYNREAPPAYRIHRHQQYLSYVMEEVLPLVRRKSGTDYVIAAGASFGGYHAANLVFKHPHAFGKLISLSAAFDIRSFLDGFYDENVYFNNPVDYLPGLDDPHALEALRHTPIVLTAGEHDPCRDANDRLSGILHAKGIGHTYERLDGAFGHDWPWWRDLIRRHLV